MTRKAFAACQEHEQNGDSFNCRFAVKTEELLSSTCIGRITYMFILYVYSLHSQFRVQSPS
jgi:hypothetical protein